MHPFQVYLNTAITTYALELLNHDVNSNIKLLKHDLKKYKKEIFEDARKAVIEDNEMFRDVISIMILKENKCWKELKKHIISKIDLKKYKHCKFPTTFELNTVADDLYCDTCGERNSNI